MLTFAETWESAHEDERAPMLRSFHKLAHPTWAEIKYNIYEWTKEILSTIGIYNQYISSNDYKLINKTDKSYI